jgi:hypothetical protein
MGRYQQVVNIGFTNSKLCCWPCHPGFPGLESGTLTEWYKTSPDQETGSGKPGRFNFSLSFRWQYQPCL